MDINRFKALNETCWTLPRTQGETRAEVQLYADRELLADMDDKVGEQILNVARLPGIVGPAMTMPDAHWGYGFPIGGVAAFDADLGGIISAGGVGFDISCGIRCLRTNLNLTELAPKAVQLADALFRNIPAGVGQEGEIKLGTREIDDIMLHGANWALARGYGVDEDLQYVEEHGCVKGVDPRQVSELAKKRQRGEMGTLGSGNHYLEVQVVEKIFDPACAQAFGLHEGQVLVSIHCGSRGLGHQICTDHVRVMDKAMASYGIDVPDRQLACVPVTSPEGRDYVAAMTAAANYGRANRQLLTVAAREAFAAVLGTAELELLYDVSHNLAKLERHDVDGERRLLCVHRKGATRALPPGHPELPEVLRAWGQPVLVPGSMGTASYVLAGVEGGGAFHSTCHGAGRTMSRHGASRRIRGRELRRQLAAQGIVVRAHSDRGLAEEAPFAYKDVDEVVATCERAGLARRVARLRPVGVVKG